MTDKLELGYGPTYATLAAVLARSLYLLDPAGPAPQLTEDTVRVLEVGVAAGGGMDYFGEVFNTSRVYGVDVKVEAGRPDQYDRIVTCSQDDPNLPLAVEHWGPFDVIVDDASHEAYPTSVTLVNLWRLVRPGGFYVIEDWNYFQGPQLASIVWQKLLGTFLAQPSVGPRSDPMPYSGVLPDVASVLIRDGMIVIRRADHG